MQAIDADGNLLGEARPLTRETERDLPFHAWKGNTHILYVKDFGGDENFHVLSVPIDGGDPVDPDAVPRRTGRDRRRSRGRRAPYPAVAQQARPAGLRCAARRCRDRRDPCRSPKPRQCDELGHRSMPAACAWRPPATV
ncbi:hypothetical protein ACU4GD_25125 [Cupriavidus basilensis]